MREKPKVIAIVGPTASGKSTFAVELAKALNGEIISADSRQVYRGLDIGSGKVTKREMQEVPHHLLDVADPKRIFTAAKYQKLARRAIADVAKRGKLPIIVGGTGFYLQAALEDLELPPVKPDRKLRAKLEKKSARELFTILNKLDPKRAKTIDAANPRRLIRAIEIAEHLGSVPRLKNKSSRYDVLKIGIATPPEKLKKSIKNRLTSRLRQGMIAEVKRLHHQGVSWHRLEALGLEYRYVAQYLQLKLSKEDMTSLLERAIYQYAKRQMTWFKRDKSIHWVN